MPHHQPAIIDSRVRELLKRLRATILGHDTEPLAVRIATPGRAVPWRDRESLDYRPITEGERWGGPWDVAWIHARGAIPARFAGKPVVLRADVDGEILVFHPDGTPWMGLTNGSVFENDYQKNLLHLGTATAGAPIDLWMEAVGNRLFGLVTTDPEQPHRIEDLHGTHVAKLVHCHLAALDEERYRLFLELELLRDLLGGLKSDGPRKQKILLGLDRAVTAFDRAGAAAARTELRPLMQVPADPASIRFTAVGHAHIDTAWLWPMRETRRKTARTFASQIANIARYEGYVFGASQPQLYEFVQQDHPSLYAKITDAVAAGRWELQGAMWVEADCNLPSGESLVRQVLHGKRFYKREFGIEVRNLWLPDVFGYSAQLPQILAKSGTPFFLTQKLSWNKVNEFPHNTFRWRGIDGSEVLAHFPPENDYNARCWPKSLINAEHRHKERGIVDEAISLFGIGDGGGGPKEEFIERAILLTDLNGVPPYRFGAAQGALERLDRHRAEYAVWEGELYFEMHRATYTSQAAMKRANRRAEEALDTAEKLQAAAGVAPTLDRAWKTILTNQFHDIIPGSSINAVYEDAVPEDHAATAQARTAAGAAAALVMRPAADACTWFNPSATPFDDLVALPAGWTGAAGATAQRDGDALLVRLAIPAHGTAVLRRADGNAATAAPAPGLVLDNGIVRAVVGADGRIVSLVLAADGRELAAEPLNDLALFEDRPHCYDAWDIDEQVLQARVGGLAAATVERFAGPLWQEVVVRGTVGASAIVQRIRLRPGSARLDIVTEVDWRERHKYLQARFPTTLVSDRFAGEVQYGHLERPTHRNTTWDSARFEVCCHRWADLSERGRGLALLNDGKYGHACLGGTLTLSLLRAPTYPDPVADVGVHRFTYSLLPHLGDHQGAPVRAEAAMLNAGALPLPGLDGTGFTLPVRVEGDGLELAVLKPAEDAGGGLIARVVEVRGGRARGRILAPGRRIIPTDLMEWRDRPEAAGDGALTVDLGAFAIETFRIR
jgi:alpha-mannosidase